MTGFTRSAPVEHSEMLPTVLVVIACVCFGSIPFFARSLTDAGMASYAVAFCRYGLSALILLPIWLGLPRRHWPVVLWGALSGIGVGLGWIGFVYALKTVPVANVGVLYMTYPVFTLLIGWAWFRDLPSKRAITGALMVIIAALLASSPAAVEPHHLPAMLVSLCAPITFGLAINILIHKLTPITPLQRVASFSLGSSLALLPLLLTSDTAEVLPQNPGHWWLVIGLALGTALVPQLIYSAFAPRIGAARSAVAGAVELPTMFLIGWFVFLESIGWVQWLACLLVTLAIVITPSRGARNLSTQIVLPGKPPPRPNQRLSDVWFDD